MRTTKEQLEMNEAVAALTEIGTQAYIKPVLNGNALSYALCASDGTQLATFTSHDAAYFTARQHDLEPVHVH